MARRARHTDDNCFVRLERSSRIDAPANDREFERESKLGVPYGPHAFDVPVTKSRTPLGNPATPAICRTGKQLIDPRRSQNPDAQRPRPRSEVVNHPRRCEVQITSAQGLRIFARDSLTSTSAARFPRDSIPLMGAGDDRSRRWRFFGNFFRGRASQGERAAASQSENGLPNLGTCSSCAHSPLISRGCLGGTESPAARRAPLPPGVSYALLSAFMAVGGGLRVGSGGNLRLRRGWTTPGRRANHSNAGIGAGGGVLARSDSGACSIHRRE